MRVGLLKLNRYHIITLDCMRRNLETRIKIYDELYNCSWWRVFARECGHASKCRRFTNTRQWGGRRYFYLFFFCIFILPPKFLLRFNDFDIKFNAEEKKQINTDINVGESLLLTCAFLLGYFRCATVKRSAPCNNVNNFECLIILA